MVRAVGNSPAVPILEQVPLNIQHPAPDMQAPRSINHLAEYQREEGNRSQISTKNDSGCCMSFGATVLRIISTPIMLIIALVVGIIRFLNKITSCEKKTI